MNYDIKIVGGDADNGQIEFERLNQLTKSTKDIATKALMFQLCGFSDIKPDKNLQKALSLYLENISGNLQSGTCLTINADHFSETIQGLQLELFKPKEEILSLTPMALVISSFQSALSADNENIDLDKPLLKALLAFKANFTSDHEIYYLANRGSNATVKITKDEFKKISILEDSIPSPKIVIVNGTLDEMKVSKSKLGLQTEQGFINVVANETKFLERIVGFMGKEVTITGKAHFKPNGLLSFIEIQDFDSPNPNDNFFSKKPLAITSGQQLLFQSKQIKKGKSFQALKEISGLLKDDITDEQFKEMIKDIHR